MMQAFPFTSNAIVRRVKDARLDLLTDPRSRRGRRYDFQAFVWTLLLSMSVGARGLRQAEDLTRNLPPGIRRVTGIWRRISDTRLRDTLFMLDYDELRCCLHRMVKAEARRGNLKPTRLPLSVVAIDGKEFHTNSQLDHPFVMKVQPDGDRQPYGRLRVHRAHLISADAAVCLDQLPIEGHTNEAGTIFDTVHEVIGTWGHTGLCDVLAMDAGNCNLATASLIDGRGKGYLMRLKQNQGTIWNFAQTHLASLGLEEALRVEVERSKGVEVERRVYRLELHSGVHTWNHARQLVRIQTLRFKTDGNGVRVQVGEEGNRYWISNLGHKQFDEAAWLTMCRQYWRIENEGNWTADTAWDEDGRNAWATGASEVLLLGLLRMMALTFVAVLRRKAQRRQGGRAPTWKQCQREVFAALRVGFERPLATH